MQRAMYMVLDNLGGCRGRVWREIDEADNDRQMVLCGLLAGEYSAPIRVVAFNPVEGWSRDVSAELAGELVQRCAEQERDVPDCLEAFIDRHLPKRMMA